MLYSEKYIIFAIFIRCKSNTSGNVANYIPQLAKVRSTLSGVDLDICPVSIGVSVPTRQVGPYPRFCCVSHGFCTLIVLLDFAMFLTNFAFRILPLFSLIKMI